jgi:hypothetical protein
LEQHPAHAPAEVNRVVQSALPATVLAERKLRLSLGGLGSTFHGGATQFGPELSMGWRTLPWLEPTLRLGYRISTPTDAPDGTIEGQAVVIGGFIDFIWPITAIASAYFPQGVNVSRVTFVAHPDPNVRIHAESAIRTAIFFSHGAGARLAINRVFSASAFARWCWTLLPAEAADNRRTVVGISGVGGEAGLAFDARF